MFKLTPKQTIHNRSLARTERGTSVRTFILSALLVAGLIFLGSLAHAQGTFQGDTQGCAAGDPCFTGSRQVGNTIVFEFSGSSQFYNVRYPVAGGGEDQVEDDSQSFTITNVEPGKTYRISVQGCDRPVRRFGVSIGRSTCTSWIQSSFTTAPPIIRGSQVVPKAAAPPANTDPPKKLGRINVGSVTPTATSAVEPPICVTARASRARNSAAATLLEAQCRSAGGDPSSPPPNTLGRINVGSVPSPQPSNGQPPICGSARAARARNSPVAASLEAQCRAAGGDPSAAAPALPPAGLGPGAPAQSPAAQARVCNAARLAQTVNAPNTAQLTDECRAYSGDPTPIRETFARVNDGSASPTPPSPERTRMCNAARLERANNSPVFAELEEDCRALGGDPSPVADTSGSVGAGSVVPRQPRPPRIPICEAARQAQANNAPNAARLAAQCQAHGENSSPTP